LIQCGDTARLPAGSKFLPESSPLCSFLAGKAALPEVTKRQYPGSKKERQDVTPKNDVSWGRSASYLVEQFFVVRDLASGYREARRIAAEHCQMSHSGTASDAGELAK
jgi:hypothetical protein